MSTVAQLLNAVYCAYFVHETVVRQPDSNLFRAAEAALHKCAIRGEITGKFDVPIDGQIAIQRVLSTYDQQLVSVPASIVVDAESRLTELLSTEFSSPIASGPDARPLH
ncbi:Fis family transcriptional regulator [Burkholderia pseudomallei]|nr:Fis family transcriptional regulator [Burkholderia pseudomallei]